MGNRLLLTGAGLSANFGAPIASGMSDLIFNNPLIKGNEKLEKLLSENFDYELIYQIVMDDSSFNIEEKKTFSKAIREAYENLDKKIITHPDLSQTYGDFFKKILFRFSTSSNGSGYIFTLNQDLLIERRFHFYPDLSLSSIELPIVVSKMFNREWNSFLSQKDYIDIAEGLEFEKAKEEYEQKLKTNKIKLSYIKLHGSQEWNVGKNNNSAMVIGHGKHDKIHSHPLLSYYWNIFKEQLNIPNSKILIIGYSFNDQHINEVLMSAKKNNGLQITSINRSSREKIFNTLNKWGCGGLIDYYYQNTLVDLFPQAPQIHTPPALTEIMELFFEVKNF